MNKELEIYINEDGIAYVPLKMFNDSLEEIERLDNELEKQNIDYGLEIEDLKEQVKYQDLWREEYLSRIDKAIEYLKNNACFNDKYFCDDLDTYECKELFNILKGSDKE